MRGSLVIVLAGAFGGVVLLLLLLQESPTASLLPAPVIAVADQPTDQRALMTPAQAERAPAAPLQQESVRAPEPAIPAHDPGSPTPAANTSNQASSPIQEALAAARRYGKDHGLTIAPELQLPTPAQESIIEAHHALQRVSADLHVVRQPILYAISEQKRARGEMEQVKTSRDMPSDLSVEERKKWLREIAAVRTPTRPGQVLITVSVGGKAFIVRVDASEDPRLQVTHEQWTEAQKVFVHRVRLAIDTGR